MRRSLLLLACLVASPARAHDLFLKLEHFVQAGATLTARLYNGSFTTSENAVVWERVREVSLVTPKGLTHPSDLGWDAATSMTRFRLSLAEPGTYVLGVSTQARALRLEGKAFNAYLEEEGVLDVLEARRRDGELEKPARERYAKHVKAVVQAGPARTPGFDQPLGYPAEIVPLGNPAALSVGGALRARCLVDGRPASGLVVLAGVQKAGEEPRPISLRSDEAGLIKIEVRSAGRYFLKFIRMARASEPGLDYESKWATLTFAVP